MFEYQKPRRELLELQLTALIDICVIIVLFLVLGTVIGAADMPVPNGLQVPRSFGKETTESAPKVILFNKNVQVVGLTNSLDDKYQKIPFSEFSKARFQDSAVVSSLKTDLKSYIDQLPVSQKNGGVLLNVIADQTTPYSEVFDVIRSFREAGFETLLFVALGENMKEAAP